MRTSAVSARSSMDFIFPLTWLWLFPGLTLAVTALSWVSNSYLWRLRNAAIAWVSVWVLHVGFLLFFKKSPWTNSRLNEALEPLTPMLYVAPLALWAVVAHFSAYYDININGVDFSIFDWMLHSTHTGRFGYSPIYDVNHFGIHSTFYLLLLAPLHALLESSLVLSVTAWVLFLAAAWVLHLLSVHLQLPLSLRLLALACYFSNPWSSRMLTGGYMPEYGFAVGYLWFLYAVLSGRRWWMVASVVFLFATKEDTPFYLACASVALAWMKQPGFTRRTWVTLFAACAAWFLVYSRLLQPWFLSQTGVTQPGYLGFWSHHGHTLMDIVSSMATHPWQVLSDLARSRALQMFWPCLFLPFFDLRTAFPLAFGIFYLGSSNYPVMFNYDIYYPLPMLAFCLVGMLLFSVAGGNTQKTAAFNTLRHDALNRLGEQLMRTQRAIHFQTILLPHVGYSTRFWPLFDFGQCRKSDNLAVIDLRQRTYPIPSAEWTEWFRRQNEKQLVQVVEEAQVAVIDCRMVD